MHLSRTGLFATAALALLINVTALSVPGYAQDDMHKRGDRACGGDARRLCKAVLKGGDFAVLGCFQQNAPRLSRSCRAFLKGVGQL